MNLRDAEYPVKMILKEHLHAQKVLISEQKKKLLLIDRKQHKKGCLFLRGSFLLCAKRLAQSCQRCGTNMALYSLPLGSPVLTILITLNKNTIMYTKQFLVCFLGIILICTAHSRAGVPPAEDTFNHYLDRHSLLPKLIHERSVSAL